jgi:hypothetical protein
VPASKAAFYSSAKLCEDVAFAEDLNFDAFDFDVRSAVLAEEDFIADGQGHLSPLAAFQQTSGAGSDDFATLRFFASGIRKNDSASCGFLCVNWLDNNAIIEGIQSHL